MNKFGEAVILCGGKSSRMGFDKALAKVNGQYLLEIVAGKLRKVFDTVKLCASSREKFSFTGLEVIEDIEGAGTGPAVAILSALVQANATNIFVTACDMPFILPEHIAYMKSLLEGSDIAYDALIPINGEHVEPLYGFYSVSAIPVFREEVAEGRYKILNILNKCNVMYMPDVCSRKYDPHFRMFMNLNYKDDFERMSSDYMS